ncbi:hypothetical protein RYX36_012806 [Vicia faba]
MNKEESRTSEKSEILAGISFMEKILDLFSLSEANVGGGVEIRLLQSEYAFTFDGESLLGRVLAERKPLRSVCWGMSFPMSLPLPVLPGLCKPSPCPSGFYEFDQQKGLYESPNSCFCKPCSGDCPVGMYPGCNSKSDIVREYNCSPCSSPKRFL